MRKSLGAASGQLAVLVLIIPSVTTGVSEGMGQYLEGAARELDCLAAIVLEDGLSTIAAEDEHSAWWINDRDVFQQTLGTDLPMSWIQSTVGWYLAEATHELRAIAVLLRTGVITGSLGPLVRAVVERVGVNAWILDVETADAMERGWRAMLNALVCGSEYRKTLDQLGVPSSVRREVAREYRDLRAQVREWFSPQVDEKAPNDATLWARSGSSYPDLTTLASIAMSDDLDQRVRRGVYAAQCGMTHPNIFLLGETIQPVEGGGSQFVPQGLRR